MLDKQDLYDREAEERVLGGMMHGDDFVDEAIQRLTSVDDVFYTKDHQLIFNAVQRVVADGDDCNGLTVSAKLEEMGELNRAGGYEYLTRLMMETTETANGLFYCDRVVDLAIRRAYRLFASVVSDMAGDLTEKAVGINSFIETSHTRFVDQVHTDDIPMVSASEIMRTEYPDSPMIVPGLVPKGMILMAGEAKAGKSYAMLNLAIAAATGGVVWSARYVEEKTNVLYLPYESDYNELKERMYQIVGDEQVPQNLYVPNLDDVAKIRLDATGLSRIANMVEHLNAGLVIIDTWQRARPDGSYGRGNAYETDSDLLAPVQTLSKALDITMVLVHHTTKGIDVDNPFNQISGSVGFQAIPDAMMLMKREEDHNRLWVRGRRMMDAQYGMTVDVNQVGVCKLFDLDDYQRNSNLSPERRQIVELLGETRVMAASEIAEITGKSIDAVRKTLGRMVANGELSRIGRGQYSLPDPIDF